MPSTLRTCVHHTLLFAMSNTIVELDESALIGGASQICLELNTLELDERLR
jgi:hypothetical protein